MPKSHYSKLFQNIHYQMYPLKKCNHLMLSVAVMFRVVADKGRYSTEYEYMQFQFTNIGRYKKLEEKTGHQQYPDIHLPGAP